MFDAFKDLGSLGSLMGKAQEMQTKLRTLQEDMAKRTITAEAGGGMVRATVNGRLELVKLSIDKSKVVVNADADVEMLEDVIVAAVSAAQARAAENMKAEMSKAAGEMGIPPGLLPG